MSMHVRRPFVAFFLAFWVISASSPLSGQSMGPAGSSQEAPAGPVGPARPGTVNPHGPGGVPTSRAGAPLPAVGPVKPGVTNPHGASLSSPVSVPPGAAPSGAAPAGTADTGSAGSGSSGTASASGAGATPVSGSLTFPKDSEPLAKGEGVVQGTLGHPTPESARLKGVEVRLFAFKNGQRAQEWRQFTQEGGTFQFAELNTSADVKYIVSAMYQAAVYLGGNLQFAEGQKLLEVPIEVKDSTAGPGPLHIKTLHIVVEVVAQDGTLRLTEILELENPGDKTLVGGVESTTTLQLDMPAGFANVQALQGLLSTQLSVGEKVLAFQGPIYPGESQLVFSYELPPKASKVFKRRMPVGASEVDVWVPPGGPAVLGPQLSQKEPITVEETTFNRFGAGALNKGAALTFSVGMGEAATSSQTSLPTLPIVSVLVFLGLAFVLQPFFRKQRSTTLSGPNAQKLQQAELISARDRALQSVKEAEFDFAAGKLTVEDHQRLRDLYKSEAIQAMSALKGLEGAGAVSTSGQMSGEKAGLGETSGPVAESAPESDLEASAGTGAASTSSAHAQAVRAQAKHAKASRAQAEDATDAHAEPAVSEPDAGAAQGHKRFCTSCGTPAEPADRFCLACGKPIRALEAPGA